MHVHLDLRPHGIVSMITHVRTSVVSLNVTALSDGTVAETASAASAQGSLAGASEREVTSMSIPNIGPEHPDGGGPDATESSRRGNPPPVLRDGSPADDVSAASARASVVTHRFGGVRYALSRPTTAVAEPPPPVEEGESDARE